MNSYLINGLNILTQSGMMIEYPNITNQILNQDNKHIYYDEAKYGTEPLTSIESNPQLKFLILFSMLDYFIDVKYPDQIGKSFSNKYNGIKRVDDYTTMLSQIFRISKIIRNTLIHNPSLFVRGEKEISVQYEFKGTDILLKITYKAFQLLNTAIFMFVKGDLGKGNYFLGIMRSIYDNILSGILEYSDEFTKKTNKVNNIKSLLLPKDNFQILYKEREVIHQPNYKKVDDFLIFSIDKVRLTHPEKVDLLLIHDNITYLLPFKALDSECKISESNLIENWIKEGNFPKAHIPLKE